MERAPQVQVAGMDLTPSVGWQLYLEFVFPSFLLGFNSQSYWPSLDCVLPLGQEFRENDSPINTACNGEEVIFFQKQIKVLLFPKKWAVDAECLYHLCWPPLAHMNHMHGFLEELLALPHSIPGTR